MLPEGLLEIELVMGLLEGSLIVGRNDGEVKRFDSQFPSALLIAMPSPRSELVPVVQGAPTSQRAPAAPCSPPARPVKGASRAQPGHTAPSPLAPPGQQGTRSEGGSSAPHAAISAMHRGRALDHWPGAMLLQQWRAAL